MSKQEFLIRYCIILTNFSKFINSIHLINNNYKEERIFLKMNHGITLAMMPSALSGNRHIALDVSHKQKKITYDQRRIFQRAPKQRRSI